MMKFLKSLFSEDDTREDDKQPESEKSSPAARPSFVQIDTSDLVSIQEKYQKISQIQLMLGQLLVSFEERKGSLHDQMQDLRNEIETEVDDLRAKYGIPEDDDNYSLNLPRGEDSVGAFIRDSQGKDDPEDKPNIGEGLTGMEVGKANDSD